MLIRLAHHFPTIKILFKKTWKGNLICIILYTYTFLNFFAKTFKSTYNRIKQNTVMFYGIYLLKSKICIKLIL